MPSGNYNSGFEWDDPRSGRRATDNNETPDNTDRYYQDPRYQGVTRDRYQGVTTDRHQGVTRDNRYPGVTRDNRYPGVTRDNRYPGVRKNYQSPHTRGRELERGERIVRNTTNEDQGQEEYPPRSSQGVDVRHQRPAMYSRELQHDSQRPSNRQYPKRHETREANGNDDYRRYPQARDIKRSPRRHDLERTSPDTDDEVELQPMSNNQPSIDQRRGHTSSPGHTNRDVDGKPAMGHDDYRDAHHHQRHHLQELHSHPYPHAFRGPTTHVEKGPYTQTRYPDQGYPDAGCDEVDARRVYPEDQPDEEGWTELANMMPSEVDRRQGTLRFRGTLRLSQNTTTQDWDDTPKQEEPPLSQWEIAEALATVREQPWPMNRRRHTRDDLQEKLVRKEMRWYSMHPAIKRGGTTLNRFFNDIDPWQRVLKKIEGKFGTSVVAVFNFLRDMIQLNLLLSLLVVGAVVVPSALLVKDSDQGYRWIAPGNATASRNLCGDLHLEYNSSWLQCNTNYREYIEDVVKNHSGDSVALVQDFLQGTGFLEWSVLFSGYYTPKVNDGHYLISLAYVLTVLFVYFISLFYVVYFVAKFLRKTTGYSDKYNMTYTNIVFTGWDFTVNEHDAAQTQHSLVVSEVKAAFDDEQFFKTKQNRNNCDLAVLYLTRLFINVMVLALIVGGWTGIYFLVRQSEDESESEEEYKQFLWEYAPTVTVSALNFVYPIIFDFVVKYEHYRGRTELFITLSRCVLIRLTSLAILVITKMNVISEDSHDCDPTRNGFICWETHLGQQIYSVLVLDFIIQIGMTFVVGVARTAVGHLEHPLCKAVGHMEFYVPSHVLDIVYTQALCWLSILYSPIMAAICFLYFCILFGLKFFTVTWTCVPPTRVFRTSRSSAMFMTILSIAFVVCLVPNGLALLLLTPSKACSPFRGLGCGWEALTDYICNMDNFASWIRWVLFALDDMVVSMSILMVAILLLTYYVTVIKARWALIKRLEKKLKYTAKDIAYLRNDEKTRQALCAARMFSQAK
ncbi:transmembrane channel-like protein 7 isoform X2 [Homarus americanus]|uniref:transmembrane channel-like protein 7 isoform X2 n=1 Tax=Homarus americanus TaxID=6706 RepID=UPI001C43CBD0|nr:transmembrane channel-like protein 7 isoform X2 [Homarus americanus]